MRSKVSFMVGGKPWELPDPVTTDITLPQDPSSTGETTRKALRFETIANNVEDETATQKLTILHHKRSKSESWEEADHFSLARLKTNEEVRLHLDTRQTKALYIALHDRYERSGGFRFAAPESEGTTVSGALADILKTLLDQFDEDELAQQLSVLGEDVVFSAAAIARQRSRQHAIDVFEESLNDPSLKEPFWDSFFRKHKWILGENLILQYVSELKDQADLGGQSIDGSGASRIDKLMYSGDHWKFLVLVDIKTPNSPLMAKTKYRNHAYRIAEDLSGVVAQLHNYQRRVLFGNLSSGENQVSRQLERELQSPSSPRAIAVIGRLTDLTPDERYSFELFRGSLHTPEILTFDEVLSRAELSNRIDELAPQLKDTSQG